MEKYGFIYVWFDKKYKRYYVGRHWGHINDGYICSSRMMRQSYKRRTQDFKRRIVSYVYTNKNDLVVEEQRWLDMIKKEELNSRYYNKTKLSSTPSTLGYNHSEETKKKIRESNRGIKRSDSTREANRQASLKQFSNEEQRQKIAEVSKKKWEDPEYREKQRQVRSRPGYYVGFKDKTHSEETKRKISETKRINNLKKKMESLL